MLNVKIHCTLEFISRRQPSIRNSKCIISTRCAIGFAAMDTRVDLQLSGNLYLSQKLAHYIISSGYDDQERERERREGESKRDKQRKRERQKRDKERKREREREAISTLRDYELLAMP